MELAGISGHSHISDSSAIDEGEAEATNNSSTNLLLLYKMLNPLMMIVAANINSWSQGLHILFPGYLQGASVHALAFAHLALFAMPIL
ncbi:MAG: hypothetical protein IMZ47_06070 [Firmicutes bacterium]|nr:hypothetical protein [Bacillota bacterium]